MSEYIKSSDLKENVFSFIDDYNALANELYAVIVTGDDANKIRALKVISASDDYLADFESDTFTVNGIIRRMLDREKIEYVVKE